MEKYTRVKQLGKGSFGAAFLVKRIKDGELCVVKEVSMAKMTTKEKEEARHEVRVLSQLSHPNITQYIEHVEKNGILNIVMEFADGGDLYQRIKASAAAKYARNRIPNAKGGDDEVYEGMLQKKGPGASGMSEDLMMHFFAQMCLAIDYLHSKHILHRDIKSMNIFLTSRGTVKVGDFGISTILRNTVGMAKTVCGTPYYFSPELCKAKPYNNKSDVWALGVLLYEMANVKHPFDASSMAALMQRICKGTYVQLPAATPTNPNAGFSRGLISLIAHCLDINVGTRYNIKQVLSTEILRNALTRLEKDLMLATVCKVRLQTVIGHYDQKSNGQPPSQPPSQPALPALPQQQQPRPQPAPIPSSVPIANKLAPKPMALPIPQQGAKGAVGVQVRSDALQVQKEIEKVDKLIAYLKQPPAPNPYLKPLPLNNNNATPTPPSLQPITPRPVPAQAVAGPSKDDATQDYIRKHQELQQIMAAHKKKVEDNLKKRQLQEDQYQKEMLAKRHQYQMDNRPKAVVKPLPPLVEKREPTPPPTASPLPPPQGKLPAITPRGAPMALAANCLPEKKDRHAAAAEAWLEEQRRQAARKKAAAEAKRGKSAERRPSAGGIDAVKGLGEYFEKRQRDQEAQNKHSAPAPPLTRADMPAGVNARKQLLGKDPMAAVDGKADPLSLAPRQQPSPSPRPSVPSLQPPRNALPAVSKSPEPSPPIATKLVVNQKAVEDHVSAINNQLAALEIRNKPKSSPPAPPVPLTKENTLDQLLQSFTKREDTRLPAIAAQRPSGSSPSPPDSPPLSEEDEEKEAVAQTLRQKDYGNMLKHIQGLNVMLDEYGRRQRQRTEPAKQDETAKPTEEEEVSTDVYPRRGSKAVVSPSSSEETFTEEEVIDTSCYIGRRSGASQTDSETSSEFSDFSEDTILDATVQGAVDLSDFADVEPLTPSRPPKQKKPLSNEPKPLTFDEQPSPNTGIEFFRLAHLCGAHFDGHAPMSLDGEELVLESNDGSPANVAASLEKYIASMCIASALSEEAVTPTDRQQDGARYRREAAAAIATIVYRLLNSIGDIDGVSDDLSEQKAKRDDAALDAAKKVLQLMLQASAYSRGSTSSFSVALTTLLSVSRRGLGAAPVPVDDRGVASSQAELDAADKYIRSLISAVTEATTSGPRGASLAKEGDIDYHGDEILEIIALVSQLIYFKWMA